MLRLLVLAMDFSSPCTLQLESSQTAWDRLSLPLKQRYFIWKKPSVVVGKETLLSNPPAFLLRDLNGETAASTNAVTVMMRKSSAVCADHRARHPSRLQTPRKLSQNGR